MRLRHRAVLAAALAGLAAPDAWGGPGARAAAIPTSSQHQAPGPTSADLRLSSDDATPLVAGAEIRVAVGGVIRVSVPVGSDILSLDPDIVRATRDGDRWILEGNAPGNAHLLIKRSGEVWSARVVVDYTSSGLAGDGAGRGGRGPWGMHVGSPALGDRAWSLDTIQAFGTGGTWNNLASATWNDRLGGATQQGRMLMRSTPDGARLTRLESRTEAERWALTLGDQMAVGGVAQTVFGVKPSVRVAEGLDWNASVGARRMPLDPLPRWGDPMLATTGFGVRRGALNATADVGFTDADGTRLPAGGATINLHGADTGVSAGGGSIGGAAQAHGTAYASARRVQASIGGSHFGAGDPILGPIREVATTAGAASLRVEATERLNLSSAINVVRQVSDGRDPQSQGIGSALATYRVSGSSMVTATAQRVLQGRAAPSRWNGGLGVSHRARLGAATAFVGGGMGDQVDMLLVRGQASARPTRNLQLAGMVNAIGRRGPTGPWKSVTQVGGSVTAEAGRWTVGARSFTFLSDAQPSAFLAATAGVHATRWLRLTAQALSNGRQNSSVQLGLSLRGRPILAPGGRAVGLSGVVAGSVFEDRDRDGVRGPDDPGIAGVPVRLDDRRVAVTREDGSFRFRGVPQGDHRVKVESDGWSLTASPSNLVRTAPLQTAAADFALRGSSFVGATVFLDDDLDGSWTIGEPLVPGVSVTLIGPDGAALASQTGDGAFTFPGLAPGVYTIKIDPLTLPPDVSVPDGLERQIEVEHGQVVRSEIALHRARSVGGRAFIDRDRDGSFTDGLDLPLAGYELTLASAQGKTRRTVQTAPDGTFTFRGIAESAPMVLLLADGTTAATLSTVGARSRITTNVALPAAPGAPITGLRVAGAPITVEVGSSRALDVRAMTHGLTDVPPPSAVELRVDADGPIRIEDGALRAIREGTAVVTAVLGRHEVEVEVQVVAPRPLALLVELDAEQVWAGDTATVVAWRLDAAGRLIRVEGAHWHTSDPRVATVDATGVLTAHDAGRAAVWASDGRLEARPVVVAVAGDASLRPLSSPPVALELIRAPGVLAPGESASVTARLVDAEGRRGSVDDGRWRARSQWREVSATGDTFTFDADASSQIEVSVSSGDLRAQATTLVREERPLAIVLDRSIDRLTPGDHASISATGVFRDGAVGSLRAGVSWTSSDPDVLVVDERGLATAVAPGRAQVSAAFRGRASRALNFIVDEPERPFLSVRMGGEYGDVRAEAGQILPASAWAIGPAGRPVEVPATLTSSDSAVLMVTASGVVAVAPGEAEVTASWDGLRSQPARVQVVAPRTARRGATP